MQPQIRSVNTLLVLNNIRSVEIKANAKINLTLDVGQKRPDGFHDVSSIMHAVSLHDRLTVTLQREQPINVALVVDGPEAHLVPAGSANIVHQAAMRYLSVLQQKGSDFGLSAITLNLTKNIPAQAGLGGGSSDAAAALLALNQLTDNSLHKRELFSIASELGSDVSFFLVGGTAWASGLGETITPVCYDDEPLFFTVAKPHIGVSTALAYAALDAFEDRTIGDSTQQWIDSTESISCRTIHNDFHTVIRKNYNEIDDLCSFMENYRRRDVCLQPPMLCGSGSSVFAMVHNWESAVALATEINDSKLAAAWAVSSDMRQ